MRERNYHRFYASLQRICVGDADDMKATLVSSFTEGRTTHLHEMSRREYDTMCSTLEDRIGWKARLRKSRSVCLRLMQQLGIDTTDWERVNCFCQDSRISGEVFYRLGVEELNRLQVKLRAIMKNGGLKPKSESSAPRQPQIDYMVLPIGNGGEA